MKLKKAIAVVAALVTVLSITVACSKDKNKDVVVYETDIFGETVTNEKGENVTVNVEDSSIEYVTDEKGNYILDSNGEKMTILHYYIHDVDENGNVVTNANKEPVTKEVTSSNETTTVSIKDIEDFIENQMTTTKVETMPEGTTISTTKRLYDKNFRDIIASGKFYIDMKMSGNLEGMGMSTNVGFAVSGNKTYAKMNINMGILDVTVENIMKDDKAYTLYAKKKVYMETDAEGEMIDSSEIQEALGSSSAKYQKTSIVTSKGKTYICEEYLVDNLTYKYYFDKSTEELKRIEYVAEDGSTMVMDVNKIVKNPSDSYFEIPAGYRKVSEEEFEKIMMGGISSIIPSEYYDE